MRLTFASEGRNTFTVQGQSCAAKPGAPCSVLLPAADLPSGWFDLAVETKRRTGMEQELLARVFLGDEAFTADCEVLEQGGDPAAWQVRCSFPEGFSGELAGRPMVGGRGTVTAAEVPLPEGRGGGVDRPLIKASLPLRVANRAGASWPKDLPVVLPVPLVQLRVAGWQETWYDPELPLALFAEPGAEVVVNGQMVPGADGPDGAVHPVQIKAGANRIEIEARKAGRAPATHSLLITSKAPDTPLYLEAPRALTFTTQDSRVRVAGRTLPYAKVYVDTRRVPEMSAGSFDVEIPLVEGPNEIQVLAVVDAQGSTRRRPPTKLTLLITSEPNPDSIQERRLPSKDPAELRRVLEAAAVDPWSQADVDVTFVLVVDSIGRSPVGESCHVRIDGQACSEEARRPVQLGFETVLASACAGIEFSAVVELEECPSEAQLGERIQVAGRIRGAVGGRVGLRTVERPRVSGSAWRPAPWVESVDPVEGH